MKVVMRVEDYYKNNTKWLGVMEAVLAVVAVSCVVVLVVSRCG
jgi:hypothetical protein